MEEAFKIPQSPRAPPIEAPASASNPRHISADTDLDIEGFVFIERTVSNSSTSKPLARADLASIGDYKPTCSPPVDVHIDGSISPLGHIPTQTTEIYHGVVPSSILARDSDKSIESDESSGISPILTPSSPTASPRYLCDEVAEISASAMEIYPHIRPQSRTTITSRHRANKTGAHWQPDGVNAGCNLQRTQLDTKFADRRGLVIPRWNPDEEIRKAQSRFRRYSKRTSTLQTEDQAVTCEVPTREPEQVQGESTMLALAKKAQWWVCLAVMLSRRVLPRLKVLHRRREALERPVRIRLRLKKKRDQLEADYLGYIWVTDESL